RMFEKYLTERERKILYLYYGLDDGEERTLEEIGSLLGVTRERIRQIRNRAFAKLRESPDGEALETFWSAHRRISYVADPSLPCCGPRARRSPAGSRVPIDRIDTGSRMIRKSYLGVAVLVTILAVPGLGSAQEAPAGQAAEGWNSPRALELIERARERRH